jgi:hypothetical protein
VDLLPPPTHASSWRGALLITGPSLSSPAPSSCSCTLQPESLWGVGLNSFCYDENDLQFCVRHRNNIRINETCLLTQQIIYSAYLRSMLSSQNTNERLKERQFPPVHIRTAPTALPPFTRLHANLHAFPTL